MPRKKHIEIFFDGSVNKKRVRRCINCIGETAAQGKEITLVINSDGGSATYGFIFYDFIKRKYINLHAIVQGEASSAGVIILLAAQKRAMTKHSMIMVHRPTFSLGSSDLDASQIRGYSREFEMMDRIYIGLISLHTGQSAEQVKKDIFDNRRFDAEEALAYGFVQKIL